MTLDIIVWVAKHTSSAPSCRGRACRLTRRGAGTGWVRWAARMLWSTASRAIVAFEGCHVASKAAGEGDAAAWTACATEVAGMGDASRMVLKGLYAYQLDEYFRAFGPGSICVLGYSHWVGAPAAALRLGERYLTGGNTPGGGGGGGAMATATSGTSRRSLCRRKTRIS